MDYTLERLKLEQKHFPHGVNDQLIRMLDDVEQALVEAYRLGAEAGQSGMSNDACIGYALLAARVTGADTAGLVRVMLTLMDIKTAAEAADHFKNSDY